MKDGAQARVYLASERGLTDSKWFRSYNTFPFGDYQDAGKPPFGPLYLLNEDTLAPERNIRLTVERRTLLVLLPVSGALDFRDSAGGDALIGTGTIGLYTLEAGNEYRVLNPYDAALVHYLQLWFSYPEEATEIRETVAFDLQKNKNALVEIRDVCSESSPMRLRLGLFNGHGKAVYGNIGAGNGVFAFVVQGAFEVEQQLIEAGDGLAIWSLQEVECEALSSEAILMLIETGPLGK
jgi:redox-sensitive bicupin YhaK (pirin superfamily)